MKQLNNANNGDNELLWVCGGLFVVLVGAWLLGHEKISAFVMKVRAFEIYLMVFDGEARDAMKEWLATTHPRDVTLNELWQSGLVAGRSLRWVVLFILTCLFGFLIYRAPDRSGKYTQKYSTDTLARQESEEWPVVKPVLGQSYIETPLNDPINGMRQLPRDYGRRHGMIVPIAGLGEKDDPANIELLDHKDALKLDRARAIFGKQLGKVWQGVSALRGYERALFAACAAQINNNNDLAQAIINDLSISFMRARKEKKAGLINSLRAQKAMHEYGNSPLVKRIVGRHAYTRTILMSMLTRARENGALPAAWFRWLKTVDRVTWYALNDLGLDVASVEAAGVRAHWDAERMAKTPIVNPMIESALVGLMTYLGEINDVEDEDA
ncbi:type IVB secretion system coupling complex protein DotM/IcmP [Chromobacterium haemolyticum]|uniref:type IVB secretion system coupling complex protein DotM/IcmP n=1 Tax=Chromobacterium haemolyticum TaxID=394935 RepID=UPI00244BF788|nr:type IVB secretion system coupling complex protein DotM/IcmP [Chromobacterium haemolyticum]MDH0342144.1 type IVB secretion system coupling complex protein DotM/IcmP [Chromobacterium haemolyticum]